MTPSGIEPLTFRFVAQHFNHCATAVPKVGVMLNQTVHEKQILSHITVGLRGQILKFNN